MSNLRVEIALRILNGGLNIWDKWGGHSHAPIRKIALMEKTKAIINHDRVLIGGPREIKP